MTSIFTQISHMCTIKTNKYAFVGELSEWIDIRSSTYVRGIWITTTTTTATEKDDFAFKFSETFLLNCNVEYRYICDNRICYNFSIWSKEYKSMDNAVTYTYYCYSEWLGVHSDGDLSEIDGWRRVRFDHSDYRFIRVFVDLSNFDYIHKSLKLSHWLWLECCTSISHTVCYVQ